MSVTHLTGPVVRVGDRVIQRCVICGDKIFDATVCDHAGDTDRVMRRMAWKEGRLLEINRKRRRCYMPKSDTPFPSDFCLALVEC